MILITRVVIYVFMILLQGQIVNFSCWLLVFSCSLLCCAFVKGSAYYCLQGVGSNQLIKLDIVMVSRIFFWGEVNELWRFVWC
jgi:hypothetical protein